jgi:hypothetical protein
VTVSLEDDELDLGEVEDPFLAELAEEFVPADELAPEIVLAELPPFE